MKVYIVLSSYPHEKYEIEGVFTSAESASNLVDRLMASSIKRYDGLMVDFIEADALP